MPVCKFTFFSWSTLQRLAYILLVMLLFCFSVNGQAQSSVADEQGLHLDWMDLSVGPDNNFFAYANGGWMKKHPIPDDYSEWGMFAELERSNQHIIQNILQTTAAQTNPPGSVEQKVGDFYSSGMNTERINKEGVNPLLPEFSRIAAIKTQADFQQVLTHLQLMGVDALFSFGQMQDFMDSSKVIATTMQGGLGLPGKDYYLNPDAKFRELREFYVQHMTRMFELLGDKPEAALSAAHTVMSIETSLAKSFMEPAELRNPHAIYHIYSLQELGKLSPLFFWQPYLQAIHHPEIQYVNVATPLYLRAMNTNLKKFSLEDWKLYLRWHLIQTFAPYLSSPFVNENFRMTAAISGSKKLAPRWLRVVIAEDERLGDAVGKLYVEKNFSPATKTAIQEMVNNIKLAMQNDLQHLSWMTPTTRAAALKKLASLEQRVGYPDQWRDYSSLSIDRGSYVLNVIRANEFLSARELNKIGKPVDKNDWEMTPQTVDAYYDTYTNRVDIPAGILQPPFYDANASDALNYGAIGFVIGHEITHAFDDQGAQFDGQGNLKNWWSKADYEHFNKLTANIVRQYSQYQITDGTHLNGRLVVGEAAADLGGIMLAYRAFHASPVYKTAPVIKGFTPDQQFFLAAAHVWANNIRPEEARRRVTNNPHPQALFRVNGTLANLPEFQEAYKLKPASLMVNPQRITIWDLRQK